MFDKYMSAPEHTWDYVTMLLTGINYMYLSAIGTLWLVEFDRWGVDKLSIVFDILHIQLIALIFILFFVFHSRIHWVLHNAVVWCKKKYRRTN